LCRLEDKVILNPGITMAMFHGDPLVRRVSEIIDRVVEAGIYKYWISPILNKYKLISRKIVLFTRLMKISASTCITCNWISTSF
jgi:hypothetical protein